MRARWLHSDRWPATIQSVLRLSIATPIDYYDVKQEELCENRQPNFYTFSEYFIYANIMLCLVHTEK